MLSAFSSILLLCCLSCKNFKWFPLSHQLIFKMQAAPLIHSSSCLPSCLTRMQIRTHLFRAGHFHNSFIELFIATSVNPIKIFPSCLPVSVCMLCKFRAWNKESVFFRAHNWFLFFLALHRQQWQLFLSGAWRTIHCRGATAANGKKSTNNGRNEILYFYRSEDLYLKCGQMATRDSVREWDWNHGVVLKKFNNDFITLSVASLKFFS